MQMGGWKDPAGSCDKLRVCYTCELQQRGTPCALESQPLLQVFKFNFNFQRITNLFILTSFWQFAAGIAAAGADPTCCANPAA